jgi:hypothetical protein
MAPRRFPAWLAAFFLSFSLVLSSCAPIQLVPAYDEQIDTGLTELYADTSSFVDRMIQSHGTPEGTYKENEQFYADSLGKVDALMARAEANRILGSCPTTKLMARALDRVSLPQQVRGEIGSLQGDCEVIMFRLIRENFNTMRAIHEHRGDRGLPEDARAQFLDGGVGAQLRAAIAVEVAKRAK